MAPENDVASDQGLCCIWNGVKYPVGSMLCINGEQNICRVQGTTAGWVPNGVPCSEKPPQGETF